MRLLREQRRRSDEPATMRDVADAYSHNRRRTIVLGALYLVLAACFFAYTAQQYVVQRGELHQQCVERAANVQRSNELYRRLARIWARDTITPAAVPLARVYRVRLAVPHC